MRGLLPGWVALNDESIEREVAPLRDASPAERLAATRRCCAATMRMLRFHPDPESVLRRVDPLRESTRLALRRLRAEFRR
jgi:hypothetical protein